MPISDATREEARLLSKRYAVARSALLPMLHLVQSEEGHVSEEGIAMCAEVLDITKAEVGAVATFYTMYKREPFGDYLLSVCTNPTCKIAGAQDILDSYVEACGGGHVDPDTGVMVEHAECLGICDAAPVVQINYEMYGPVTHDQAMDLLTKAKAGDPPASNRSGDVPATIRAVHREFSGIDDGVNDQLIEAARLQAAAAVPPAWRTGETDIPVTHPGGDPAGHGGELFRAESGFSDGVATAETGADGARSAASSETEQGPPAGPDGADDAGREGEVAEDVAAASSDVSGELAEQVTSDDPPAETAPTEDQPTTAGPATPAESEQATATGTERDPQDSMAGEPGTEDLDEPVADDGAPGGDDAEREGS